MATLMQANRQWSTRPDDERFTSLYAMQDHFHGLKRFSRPEVINPRGLHFEADNGSDSGLVMRNGKSGKHAYAPTHHAFAQLAQLGKAPAGFLRTLPAPMVANIMNYRMSVRGTGDDVENSGNVQLLLYKNGESLVRAATGEDYGRVWCADVVDTLCDRFGDGVSGDWRVPGEFGKAVTVDTGNTTLFGSDRDMFVFLADEINRIEIPNRRNGQSGSLARGFFLWNSEVGSRTIGIATFLFDYACSNRIVWGASEYTQIKLRHTRLVNDRWLAELEPALVEYSNSSGNRVRGLIEAAQNVKINKLEEFLGDRFGKRKVGPIIQAHMVDEGRPIETIWDAVTAVTAFARSIPFQDDRVALEGKAGELLKLAA